MMVTLVLLTIVVIIPAAIVTPFINAGDDETYQTPTDEVRDLEEPTLEDEYVVSVFRSQQKTVDDVPLEQYVTGVVASEMPADFELEALKAQALAARTYVVKHVLNEGEQQGEEGQITDTVQHQVYKSEEELKRIWGSDYNWKINKIKKAVAATQGEILTYNGEPITPAFFSTSNGYTENAEDYWTNPIPYLKSVASPWDEESPKFKEQKILTLQEVEQKLNEFIKNQLSSDNLVSLATNSEAKVVSRTSSDRVKEVSVGGITLTGRNVREALDLRSSDFTVTFKDQHYVFTTEGYGHGVGMSQYGANGMAKEGKTYKEIVNYYYTGTEITNIGSDPERVTALKREGV
ncbi:stage II sporulation protein D [Salirhabdus euzebyi]|nr:stage II sporulation protein D [Salirhabdus euzebyi]